MGLVYKCTNIINNKSYIGITIRKLNERITDHKYQANNNSEYYFHRALKKYGFENFKWEILEKCENNLLEEKEVFYIKKYKSFVHDGLGYNMTTGGRYNFGSKGEHYWLNRLSNEDKEKWLLNNRYGKNNGMYKNGNITSGENHFLNKMTSSEKEKWLNENLKGENNYQKHLSKKELKDKCWFNNVDIKTKNNYIEKYLKGKNNPMYKKAKTCVITLPDGNEYITKISYFCKTYSFIKLHGTGFYNVLNGTYSHYKKFKCRLYNEKKDLNIKEWKEEYGI